ncbi:Multidrug resistance operon repressor [uncultured Clostridium sp.]|uniref:MarR family winged helix-turn-helix transcriptional regulator n=1 Tax=uncultured Clostridium sp. TaxID=59620 RepID=UPI0008220A08|nr:MarR family transcriptional regulator [uncultured Clostridium sp.]SCJ93255.1 Multidrug resistance operon repressor [uncultured Clostridium sp.]
MKLYETEGIGRYIGYFHRLGATHLTKEYEKYGIGVGQYQFLILLYLKDGISHDELTEKAAIDKANTTRAIKKLESEGYVRLEINDCDKRKFKIYLTDKALEIKDELLKISFDWEQRLLEPLSSDELDSLFFLLRKIARNQPGYFFKEEENK